jgi:hypothetical protein
VRAGGRVPTVSLSPRGITRLLNSMAISTPRLGPRQWGQCAAITAAALAVYAALRLVPIGTNLNHIDFRVAGPGVIEFCDPANPAFIPVVDVRSPVEMRLRTPVPPRAGEEVAVTVRLNTASGKPIGPRDLLVAHTERLHLLVVDPGLGDYQHLHPQPGREEGAWDFVFTPRFGGTYRVFADFVPAATGRGLYAFADLVVAGEPAPATLAPGQNFEAAAHRFIKSVAPARVRAGQTAELALAIEPLEDRGEVPLEPVMGAFAHVVAFDTARSGFAHLHPLAEDPLAPPDRHRPELRFQVTMPRAGDYVLWAQVRLGGSDVFAPFGLTVVP